MNPLTQVKKTILPLLMAPVLACFGLSPAAQAVVPPPDGGYALQNTAAGEDALFSLTTSGLSNTALGFHALVSNTDGDFNTANVADFTHYISERPEMASSKQGVKEGQKKKRKSNHEQTKH
jgi:hypothetical protein